jgi:hypothetical protein
MEGQRFRALDEKRRENYVLQAREIRKFSGERRKLESQSVTTGDRSTAGSVDVLEKFKRSPVIGRRADRFAKDEAPPARPEVSTTARGKGSAERRETGRTETAPQRRTEATPQRRTEAAPQRRTEAVPQRRTEAAPQRRTEAVPQRRAEATPQRRTEAVPQRRTEAAPQRRPDAVPRSEPRLGRGTDGQDARATITQW